MNKFGYRNVWYDARKKSVFLWSWDDKGNRIESEVPFNPYLFVETAWAMPSALLPGSCKRTFPS